LAARYFAGSAEHQPAPARRITRDGFLTRAYVQGLSPEQAADVASREYKRNAPGGVAEKAAGAERDGLVADAS
jgi:hypothetical protein